MKKFLSIITVSSLVIPFCLAGFLADINLSWQPNPASEFVTKYVVYQAKAPSTNFVAVVTATGTNFARVRVTSPGTYQFRVSAVNGVGESDLSQGVQVPNIPPTIPTNVSVISVTATNTP